MSGMSLYYLLKLTTIGYALYWVGGIFLAFVAVSAICTAARCICGDKNWWDVFKKFKPKTCIAIGTIIIMVAVVLPTSKQMAIIYVVPKVANGQMVQKIPQKILLLSEEWFEELRPKKNKVGKNTSDNNRNDR